MAAAVFLDYTQEALDRSFDQRAWVPDVDAILAEREQMNAQVRGSTKYHADLAYGAGEDEALDLFSAGRADAPVLVFVHGGAWRNFAKEDFSLVAPAFNRLGLHCAILGFSKLPKARLPHVVDQVRRGVAWVRANVSSNLYLMGNSSGAHLAAVAAVTLPSGQVKGAILGSGIYDLAPVMLSARSAYIDLEPDEVRALSPIHHLDRLHCKAFVAYAENDTPEFRRQSLELAAALEKRRCLAGLHRIDGANHFDSVGRVAAPDGTLAAMMLQALQG